MARLVTVYDQNEPPPRPAPPDLDRKATWRTVPWNLLFSVVMAATPVVTVWLWPNGDEERQDSSVPLEQLEVGDCFELWGRGSRAEILARSCSEPHEYQVYRVLVPWLLNGVREGCATSWAETGLDEAAAPFDAVLVELERSDRAGADTLVCVVEFPETHDLFIPPRS